MSGPASLRRDVGSRSVDEIELIINERIHQFGDAAAS